MPSVEFMRPFVFLAVVAALAFFVFLAFFAWRRKVGLLSLLGEDDLVRSAKRKFSQSLFLALAFIVAAGVALAGPFVPGDEELPAVKVIIVIDVSYSMGAKDYPPPIASRMGRAREALSRLFARYPYGEGGIVIFGGTAFPWVRRLPDVDALGWMIQNWLQVGMAPTQGSDLQVGLETALPIAESSFRNDVVVILVSDGGDATGVPRETIARYQTRGIKIVSVGVGNTQLSTFELDGKAFQTRLNELPLRAIATMTGGAYVRIWRGPELVDVFSGRPDLLRTVRRNMVGKDFYRVPLWLALFFFVLWSIRVIR
ncbi:MAG: VWA domain-containing protein [Parcubacteria group bacterium]|nr:VWA domain-containing protein [Parcubacteria group bacterium]